MSKVTLSTSSTGYPAAPTLGRNRAPACVGGGYGRPHRLGTVARRWPSVISYSPCSISPTARATTKRPNCPTERWLEPSCSSTPRPLPMPASRSSSSYADFPHHISKDVIIAASTAPDAQGWLSPNGELVRNKNNGAAHSCAEGAGIKIGQVVTAIKRLWTLKLERDRVRFVAAELCDCWRGGRVIRGLDNRQSG